MRGRLAATTVLLVSALAAAMESAPAIVDDFFPYQQGWLGGDAAYSIPLNATTTVWLFGDTFVGKGREASGMIHNSIAIRRCQGKCGVTYWWGWNDRKPDAFFRTATSNYFWPLDGFVFGGKLYVFLEQMHATGDGGAFGFDYSGVELATVSNPSSEPDQWHITYRRLTSGNRVVPGIAAGIVPGSGSTDLFVFTLYRPPGQEPFVGLARLPLADLLAKEGELHWSYLSGHSGWRDWRNSAVIPEDGAVLLRGNVTEMSVKYHPGLRRWIAMFPTPGFLASTVSYSTASQLSGPWTTPHSLFSYPEVKRTDGRYTSNVFCYAAKEHVELEAPGQIAFTYACNSTKESEIFRDMGLYRPELVRMELAGVGLAERGPVTHGR